MQQTYLEAQRLPAPWAAGGRCQHASGACASWGGHPPAGAAQRRQWLGPWGPEERMSSGDYLVWAPAARAAWALWKGTTWAPPELSLRYMSGVLGCRLVRSGPAATILDACGGRPHKRLGATRPVWARGRVRTRQPLSGPWLHGTRSPWPQSRRCAPGRHSPAPCSCHAKSVSGCCPGTV